MKQKEKIVKSRDIDKAQNKFGRDYENPRSGRGITSDFNDFEPKALSNDKTDKVDRKKRS